jgi:hypothetical protein
MPSKPIPKLPTIAFNKRRVPTAGAHRQRTKSFNLPKQAKSIAQNFCSLSLPAQYQAFVHVAVGSSTAFCAQIDLRFGTFQSAGLSLLGSTRSYLRGQRPWTDLLAGT